MCGQWIDEPAYEDETANEDWNRDLDLVEVILPVTPVVEIPDHLPVPVPVPVREPAYTYGL